MAYAERAETAATKQSRKRANRSDQRAVLLVVARKQERSSSRERRGDGRATEEEAEETFKGVSFISGLPLDLATEVLRRLPLRSLVQMRTLCSSFNALLQDRKVNRLLIDVVVVVMHADGALLKSVLSRT